MSNNEPNQSPCLNQRLHRSHKLRHIFFFLNNRPPPDPPPFPPPPLLPSAPKGGGPGPGGGGGGVLSPPGPPPFGFAGAGTPTRRSPLTSPRAGIRPTARSSTTIWPSRRR